MLTISHAPLSLAAAALAAVTLGLSACGGDEDATLQEKTLEFTERDTDYFNFVDAAPKTTITADGPEAVSNGDQLTFASDLLDGSGTDVGDADVSCTFTRATARPERGVASGPIEDSSAVCAGTMTVPGGSLTLGVGGKAFAEGAQEESSTTGAVLGGTGDYAGATGDFISQGEPAVDTIHVFVPQN